MSRGIIWIFDDREDESLPLARILRAFDLDVETESIARRAIQRINKFAGEEIPKVVLLDLMWYEPESDTTLQEYQWWDILGTLHVSTRLKNVPVIALTNKISREASEQMGRFISDDVRKLDKPMTAESLVSFLEFVKIL